MKAFSNYHPAVEAVYFISVLLFAMFVQNPVIELSALVGGILFCCVILESSEAAGNIGFYVPMFFLTAITNPLFSHNGVTPLFFLNGNPVTLEAFVCGIFTAVMVIAVMLWFRCYSEIMTSDKFLYLFGRTMPKLSLVLSMTLRFIPMFKRQMHRVSRAQKTMGLYSSKSFLDRIKSALRVFSAMIAWSIENSMETSASMKARGYGLKGRTNFSMFRFYAEDIILLSVCTVLSGITVSGIFMGKTTFYYYPKITELNLSLYSIFVYTAFCILSFLPFIIEVKERIKWKYYISKI